MNINPADCIPQAMQLFLSQDDKEDLETLSKDIRLILVIFLKTAKLQIALNSADSRTTLEQHVEQIENFLQTNNLFSKVITQTHKYFRTFLDNPIDKVDIMIPALVNRCEEIVDVLE